MRAIVTGVAGFIGAHVAERLLQRGYKVAGIDDLSGGSRGNVPSEVQFFERDCSQPLTELFQDLRPDVVLHLAAYAAEGLSHHIPQFNYHNNLLATSNVLTAAYESHARHFVFTSSIAAYGHPVAVGPLDEETTCHPCDPYGVAKLACEQHIAAFCSYFGQLSFTIFRPHNVFGPKQNIADPFRNVVGIFFRCMQEGLPLPIFGDGSQTRSFSYIDLVAHCIAASVDMPQARNEVFNVGSDESLSVLELARVMQRIVGSDVGIQLLPGRKEVAHAHADHQKLKAAFGEVLSQQVSIEEGLHRTADYLSNRAIPPLTPCPAPLEISDGLPESWQKRFRMN